MSNFSKTLPAFLLLGIGGLLIALCAPEESTAPQPVYSVRKAGIQPQQWYREQAIAWKNYLADHPKDEDGWINYYQATHYQYFGQPQMSEQRKAELTAIVAEIGRKIPESYAWHLCSARLNGDDLAHLEKAHQLKPQHPLPLYGLIAQYLLKGENEKFMESCRILYNSGDIHRGLLEYNYNVLAGIEKNAILFTNGDNDTYPLWVLQAARKIRPDVTVINIPLARAAPDYLAAMLAAKAIAGPQNLPANRHSPEFLRTLCAHIRQQQPNLPVYFAATVHPTILEPLNKELYLVGLAFRYSEERFENMAALAGSFENEARLDYIDNDWYDDFHPTTPLLKKQMHLNYLAAFLKLYEHYSAADNPERAGYWRDFAYRVAQQGGKVSQVDQYFLRRNSE